MPRKKKILPQESYDPRWIALLRACSKEPKRLTFKTSEMCTKVNLLLNRIRLAHEHHHPDDKSLRAVQISRTLNSEKDEYFLFIAPPDWMFRSTLDGALTTEEAELFSTPVLEEKPLPPGEEFSSILKQYED